MRKHLTDGELRAALDGELEDIKSLQHLEACADCQARQKLLQAENQQTARSACISGSHRETVPICARRHGINSLNNY